MLLRQSKWRIMSKKRFVFIYYLILNFVHQSNCGLCGHGSYLNYITDLCFGIDTDSLLIMSASVVYQNDWHAGMHWRNCISILHSLIFVKLNMPITKVCFFIFVASFNLMRSALPFLFISSFAPHCRPPNGWAQCHPLPTFHVGPIFSPSCAWLRGCVKVGTVLWVFADSGRERMKEDWRGAIVLILPW